MTRLRDQNQHRRHHAVSKILQAALDEDQHQTLLRRLKSSCQSASAQMHLRYPRRPVLGKCGRDITTESTEFKTEGLV